MLLIEGEIHLNNFLVDYRDEYVDKETIVNERQLCTEDINNSEAAVMVIVNDLRASGNISNIERIESLREMKLRNDIRISLMDHDIHRPRKDKWDIYEHNYVTRN